MPARSPLAPFLEPLDRLGFPYCKLEFLREGGQDKHIRDIRFIRAATELDLISRYKLGLIATPAATTVIV